MIRMDIKRTDFFSELSEEKQQEYFEQKRAKFIPNIDNIYYNVSVKDDRNDNPSVIPLLERLDELKREVRESRSENIPFLGDLYITTASAATQYKYCATNIDLYDIFITDYLQNDVTPRCHVQLRAYGLWLYGYKKMIEMSFASAEMLFSHYGMQVHKVMENRIDYCYHTNAIQDMQCAFGDVRIKETMQTNLRTYHKMGRIARYDEDYNELKVDYFALGERKSNNVYIRIYNKVIEVIEKGYKAYFFPVWLQEGLTNFYDNFCFEYAYTAKNYEYIHRAKLEFYLHYGKDEERKRECKEKLDNKNLTSTAIQKYVNTFMPECTTVMNVEYMTKRKFYYTSDDFIENVLKKVNPAKDVAKPCLLRLFTILHNRPVFLEYLTHESLRFIRRDSNGKILKDTDGKEIYVDWWERLRNVKLVEGGKSDLKLIRKYCQTLDLGVMKSRYVNTVATLSVYMRKDLGHTFVEDYTDVFSLLNDNHKQEAQKYMLLTESAEIISDIDNDKLANDYRLKKISKENKLKNRLERHSTEERADEEQREVQHEEIKAEMQRLKETALDALAKTEDNAP